MFCLNENNIYHLYTQGIEMRKGVEGLWGIIRTYQYSQSYQSRSLCLYEQITYSGNLAVISTLIQTCELLGINPKEWFSKTFSRNIITLPLRRKQISQSLSIKTLAYLFYTIRPALDAYVSFRLNIFQFFAAKFLPF